MMWYRPGLDHIGNNGQSDPKRHAAVVKGIWAMTRTTAAKKTKCGVDLRRIVDVVLRRHQLVLWRNAVAP